MEAGPVGEEDLTLPLPPSTPPFQMLGSPRHLTLMVHRLDLSIRTLEHDLDSQFTTEERIAEALHDTIADLELSAFDHALAAYSCGRLPDSSIRTLLTSCFSISDGAFTLDFSDSEHCLLHISRLHTLIAECVSSLSSSPQSDFSASLSAISSHLQSLRADADALERPFDKSPTRVPPRYSVTFPTLDRVSFQSAPLTAWFLSRLPSLRDRAELSDVVSSVAFRVCVCRSLQANVSSLRQMSDFDGSPPALPDVISSSPFVAVREQECLFLRDAIAFLERDSQTSGLVRFAEELERFYSGFTARSSSALSEFRAHIDALEGNHAKRKRDLADLWSTVDSRIDAALRGMAEDHPPPPPALPEALSLLEADNRVVSARRLHARLCERREVVIGKLRALAGADRRVFEAVAELAKRDDEETRLRRELEQLRQYEQNMRELLMEMKTASDAPMLERLQEMTYKLHVAILTHKQREETVIARTFMPDAEQQIAEIDAGIREREEEMRELGKKLLAANQRQMRVEESAALAEGRRVALGSNRVAEETQRMLCMVMCPVCLRRKRECLLRGCRHAICRPCLTARKGRSCPVCAHACVAADVCPFLLGQGAPMGRAEGH